MGPPPHFPPTEAACRETSNSIIFCSELKPPVPSPWGHTVAPHLLLQGEDPGIQPREGELAQLLLHSLPTPTAPSPHPGQDKWEAGPWEVFSQYYLHTGLRGRGLVPYNRRSRSEQVSTANVVEANHQWPNGPCHCLEAQYSTSIHWAPGAARSVKREKVLALSHTQSCSRQRAPVWGKGSPLSRLKPPAQVLAPEDAPWEAGAAWSGRAEDTYLSQGRRPHSHYFVDTTKTNKQKSYLLPGLLGNH